MEKMTRRDYFEAIKEMAAENGNTAIMEFAEAELTKLAARSEKDKEKRAEKRAESDELLEQVFGVVTDELRTADQLVEALTNAGVEASKAKVVNRLSLLAANGRVERTDVLVEGDKGSRKVKAYRLTTTE